MNTRRILAIAGIALAGLVLLTGALPAAARAETQQAAASQPALALHERDHLLLEHALQRLSLALQIQSDRLDLANLTVSQTREWIDRLRDAGKDTSALEAALAAFDAALASARAIHDDAQALADSKAGFDASGHVIDEGQARQTVKNTRDRMRACAETINPAARAFREAIRSYRETLDPGDDAVNDGTPDSTLTE